MDRYHDSSSSPDPLNDDSIYTSPMKDKQPQSQRGRSVSIRPGSPRKQTFELELGDRDSPRKIRVTVEAESLEKENRARIHRSIENSESPTRKRKTAPASRRRGSTTITTVPLKGSTDDEDNNVTPTVRKTRGGKIGLLRKSNGTPIARAIKKRILTPGAGNGQSDGIAATDLTPLPRGLRSIRSSKSIRSVVEGTKISIETSNRVPATPIVAEDVEDEVGIADLAQDNALPILDEDDRGTSMLRPDAAATTSQNDILLAEFGREETPDHTGWSSPKLLSAARNVSIPDQLPLSQRISSTTRGHGLDESHESFSDDAGQEFEGYLQRENDSIETLPHTRSSSRLSNDGHEPDQIETMIADEDFTMIGMDTVRSFQNHNVDASKQRTAHMPGIVEACGLSTRSSRLEPSGNSQLLSGANVTTRPMYGNSTASFRSVREPSFTSIESKNHDPTSPGRNLPTPRVTITKPRTSSIESRQSQPGAASQGMDVHTPESKVLGHDAFQRLLQQDRITNSFPGIESAIEDTAPAERSQPGDIDSYGHSMLHTTGLEASEPFHSVAADGTAQRSPARDASHLISPDDTASDDSIEDSVGSVSKEMHELATTHESPSSDQQSQHATPASHEQSAVLSHVGSSPPSISSRKIVHIDSAVRNDHVSAAIQETPTILFSSPTLPPPPMPIKNTVHDMESEFPSIVRAGLKLQNISNAPVASHRSSSHLGSPFRSSPSRKSDSARKSPAEHPNQDISPSVDKRYGHQTVRHDTESKRERTRDVIPLETLRSSPRRPTAIIPAQSSTQPIERGFVRQHESSSLSSRPTNGLLAAQGVVPSNQTMHLEDHSAGLGSSSTRSQALNTTGTHQQLSTATPQTLERTSTNSADRFPNTHSAMSGANADIATETSKTVLSENSAAKVGAIARGGRARREFNPASLLQLREEREARLRAKSQRMVDPTKDIVSHKRLSEPAADARSLVDEPSPIDPGTRQSGRSEHLSEDSDILHDVLMSAVDNSQASGFDDAEPIAQIEEDEEEEVDVWLEEYKNSSLLDNSLLEEPDIKVSASAAGTVVGTPNRDKEITPSSIGQHGENRSRIAQIMDTAAQGHSKQQTPETNRDSEERRLEYMSSVPQLETSRILESFNSSTNTNITRAVTDSRQKRKCDTVSTERSHSPNDIDARGSRLRSKNTIADSDTFQESAFGAQERGWNDGALITEPKAASSVDASNFRKRIHVASLDDSPTALSQDSRNSSIRGRKYRRLSAQHTTISVSSAPSKNPEADGTRSNLSPEVYHVQGSTQSTHPFTIDNTSVLRPQYVRVALPSSELGDLSGLSQLHESTQLAASPPRRRTKPMRDDLNRLLESSPANQSRAPSQKVSRNTSSEQHRFGFQGHSRFIPSPPTSQEKDSLDERNSSCSTQQDTRIVVEHDIPQLGAGDYIRESIEEDLIEDSTNHSESIHEDDDAQDAEEQLEMEHHFAETLLDEADDMSNGQEDHFAHARQLTEEAASQNEETHSDQDSGDQEQSVVDLPETPDRSSLIYSLLNNVAPLAPSAQTPSPQKSCIRNPKFQQAVPKRNISWKQNSSFTTDDTSNTSQSLTYFQFRPCPTAPSHQLYPPNFTPTATKTTNPLQPTTSTLPILSSTQWTNAHWQLLEHLLHDIRDNLPLDAELEVEYGRSKLLNRWIVAEEEEMRIEAWHLDVVACFGDFVRGWEEWEVLRRVFGLVKGEERRLRRGEGEVGR